MQKEKNGSMKGKSRPKDIVQNHSKPFQDVLASFEALVEVEDPVRHEFELIREARRLKLPVSSYRMMYHAWMKQQEDGYELS
jgi:hypothetical protein